MEDKKREYEQLCAEMTRELEDKDKIIWRSMWIIMLVSIIALISGVMIFAFLIPEGIWQIIGIVLSCIVFLAPCFWALKLEVSVGSYRCGNCGHKIVPTYSEALWAMHSGPPVI